MYVIPFSMGPVGSPIAQIGVQISDSPYVVVNMRIMTRMGDAVLKALGPTASSCRACTRSACRSSRGRRMCPGRAAPIRRTSTSSTSPKSGRSGATAPATAATRCWARSASRCASLRCMARDEGWLAEHMLIIGVKSPNGEKTYVAAAFPSACGKTNFAMLIPPKEFQEEGWEVTTVGDDIAWIKPGDDGKTLRDQSRGRLLRRRPGHELQDQPERDGDRSRRTRSSRTSRSPTTATCGGKAWTAIRRSTPSTGRATTGRPAATSKAAHANSRFTAPMSQCPSADPAYNDPKGVPISAFIFGGRRSTAMPLVSQAFNWAFGVYIGRDDGLGNDGRRVRPDRPGPPRSVRDAAVLRLPHGRLLRPLARLRPQAARTRRGSSTSTGSAATRTANSCGPASARTCAC